MLTNLTSSWFHRTTTRMGTEWLSGVLEGFNSSDPGDINIPGTPPTQKFEGQWFTTQLTLSLAIGLGSFLIFSLCRNRWPILFAPRTKLKGFSPHEAHTNQSFAAWIIPMWRTSEFTVLQTVGLDAAVLLGFFKMSFYLFSVCSLVAIGVIMPMNYVLNGKPSGDPDEDGEWLSVFELLTNSPSSSIPITSFIPKKPQDRSWLDLVSDASSHLTVHLLLTYLFTGLTLRFCARNYSRFVRARQLYSLELVHSIPARTVMCTRLPLHLRGERTLANYFESMNLRVESVSICRAVNSLDAILAKRTDALLKLENAWTDYVGNPSVVESYDPSLNVRGDAVSSRVANEDGGESGGLPRLVVPHQPRPTLRPSMFGRRVDALEWLEARFREADEVVRRKRRLGKFDATDVAFVTFEEMASAQIAAQVEHNLPSTHIRTAPAPEPRDIYWPNVTLSPGETLFREVIVLGFMGLLLSFWSVPVAGLASLLSYKEIKKVMPWLAKLIDMDPRIQALVQNSLPSFSVTALNSLLPFLLEALSYLQGNKARSWAEYALLKKYFLFLLINVVFIFLLASTYWALVRDLANAPIKVPEKLAQALQRGQARHFFLSYVMLQALGIMPLQLLNIGIIVPRVIYQLFTKTPRDYAELNAPPMINYGVVYPLAILVFVITMIYSIIQPLILIFGALYFGMAYLVYKYKLMFVFYKPAESRGEAWPITFRRLMWGLTLFQIFMTGIFTLKQSFVLASLMAPLIFGTLWWAWWINKEYVPLSTYVSLSALCEVQRGTEEEVTRMRRGEAVSASQSHLNKRRYAQNDETLYVAPEDERTDYSQQPMANWYWGVLNTGRRRYGHPALTGVLPTPWLPLKKGQTLANYIEAQSSEDGPADRNDAVVLTLRQRRTGRQRRNARHSSRTHTPGASSALNGRTGTPEANDNPWREDSTASGSGIQSGNGSQNAHHKLVFDHATGVIVLPEDSDWMGEDESSADEGPGPLPTETVASPVDEESLPVPTPRSPLSPSASQNRHSTYFHHPERRRSRMPGGFPRS
ncbi:putative membrane protein YLR241W OS=Saccharomyces cerevisiae (strain ATCC 204508 / S288c) GN=YLR241W PE=1 SV=1 [Rhizoctonia solani AG-1 IB]|uniref:Putative membrane protein YLR241W n=1 Tax=Thanatephorus cucumeris (strain AG1-IB / isolate 7/3/14) TaxID=1108050 RepID=A0A0B7FZV9_THACB|nr:putative membrane protein YLR241W OS=Saccharomyces cerevisiae (strain ATCC 204508 / S288c) GN=YLR241W PE=1 SV=1 [Rhizoctonia solani AG-1 IB]